MQTEIVFDKPRSVKACMADGWRIVALGWKPYFKALWIYLILVGTTGAFFIEILANYLAQHAVPAYQLHQLKSDKQLVQMVAIPEFSLGIYLILAFIFALVGRYCLNGRLFDLMQNYRKTNYMPKDMPLHLSKNARKHSLKLWLCDTVFALINGMLCVLFALPAMKWSVWILIPLPFLLIYMLSTWQVARLHTTLGGMSLVASIKKALKQSMGHSFIVQFTTLLPTAIIWLIFALPIIIYICVRMASGFSEIMGDGTGLPGYLSFIFFVLNTIGLMLCTLIASVRVWALALKQEFEKHP